MAMEFETEVTVDGEPDVLVVVKIGHSCPGTHDTYHDQGDPTEAEITGVYLTDKPDVDVWDKITKEDQDKLYDKACERVEEDAAAAYEDAQVERYHDRDDE